MALQQLQMILDESGLKYTLEDDSFALHWKTKHRNSQVVSIIPEESKNAVLVATLVQASQGTSSQENLLKFLLRRNTKLLYLKYSISKTNDILLLSEIPGEFLREDAIKERIFAIILELDHFDEENAEREKGSDS